MGRWGVWGDEGDEGERITTNAPCPMPHAPCPMPHAQVKSLQDIAAAIALVLLN